ncbi:MAG TPA: hypothetical protein VN704_09960, partial [Verrucomicrobiae bacterium]|nr:hypothetical protein [Verrucomicrobiae bacterium]
FLNDEVQALPPSSSNGHDGGHGHDDGHHPFCHWVKKCHWVKFGEHWHKVCKLVRVCPFHH